MYLSLKATVMQITTLVAENSWSKLLSTSVFV